MKKLYSTLALAAAVAISATAGDFTLRQDIVANKNVKSLTAKEASVAIKNFDKASISASKAAAKAAESESIEGNWVFILGDYYKGEDSQGAIQVTFKATYSNGLVMFEDPNQEFLPFIASLNETTGILTIAKTLIGQVNTTTGATYYCQQEPFEWNNTTESLDYKEFTGQYDAANGTISFADDLGLDWAAYSDEACTQYVGTFDRVDLISAQKEVPIVLVPMGTGSLTENFVAPLFGVTNTEPCSVELSYDEANHTTIYVHDPLKQFYAAKNINSESPEMTLDISDFNNVLIPLTATGVGNQASGAYVYFSESWYNANFGEGEPFDESLRIKLTIDGTTAKIDMPAQSIFIMGMTDGNGGSTQLASSLTFDASQLPSDVLGSINSVAADSNADAPVEYFNLQGVRVANPAAGQLVIKRQGDNVSKVVIR